MRTVAIADAVMSLDNVLAIAAVAGDSTWLLVLGLAISIPLIVVGASAITFLLERFPILVWADLHTLPERRAAWLQAEGVATLQKPFEIEELVTAITELLGGHVGPQSA